MEESKLNGQRGRLRDLRQQQRQQEDGQDGQDYGQDDEQEDGKEKDVKSTIRERPGRQDWHHKKAPRGRKEQTGGDRSKLGQLVLMVDLAPPADGQESDKSLAGEFHHRVELSLGIEQTTGQLPCDSSQQPTGKRCLVYERVDKFFFDLIGSPTCAPGFELPFKSRSFDACLCFNLLNFHLATGRSLAAERRHELAAHGEPIQLTQRQEDEQHWLEMSRLTSELRLTLLEEISRVVRLKGKFMINVFAYDCHSGPNGCNARQQQEAAQASSIQASSSDNIERQQRPDEEEEEQLKLAKTDSDEDSCCPRCRLEWIKRRQGASPADRRTSKVANFIPTRRRSVGADWAARSDLSNGGARPDHCDRAQDSASTSGQPDNMARRYSSAILRALGVSSGEQTELASFQIRRDSISEAAKRLGQRLSAASGSPLLSRIWFGTSSADNNQQDPNVSSQQQQQQQKQCDISVEMAGQQEANEESISTETPAADLATNEPSGARAAASMGNSIGQQADSRQLYLMSNLMNLFQDKDFAQRHRQSIAVQTFFTKSIEVSEDMDGLLCGSPTAETGKLACANEEPTKCEHEEQPASEPEEDDETTTTTDTTSGWTAPTSCASSASRAKLAASNLATADKCNYIHHHDRARQLNESSGEAATSGQLDGLSNQDQIAARQAKPLSCSGQPQRQLLQRPTPSDQQIFASDLSSFTLNTTPASSNSGVNGRCSIPRGPEEQQAKQVADLKQLNKRRTSTISVSTTTTTTTSGPDDETTSYSDDPKLQQRRAFSETEAYRSQGAADRLEGADTAGSAELRPLGADRSQLPAYLGLCGNPAEIGSNGAAGKQSAAVRQIRSAEPTNYNSPGLNSSTNSSANGGAPIPHQLLQQQLAGGGRTRAGRPIQPLALQTSNTTSNGSPAVLQQQQRHHSLTSLIGTGSFTRAGGLASVSHHAYHPLREADNVGHPPNEAHPLQQPPHGYNRQTAGEYWQPGIESGRSKATRNAAMSAQAARHQQQQQWCHSNTFSSSLNSDISSGGPKDTSEKESSRRTSTLSGISSIYQQETSLGLATPHSNTGSTPANSQAAAMSSNMGSIPELASVDGRHTTTRQEEQQPPVQQPQPNELVSDLGAFARRDSHHLKHRDDCDPFEGAHPLRCDASSTSTSSYADGENPSEGDEALAAGDQLPTSPINLQRVAASLRSQLRERFATMRTFNALIGGLNQPAAPSSTLQPSVQQATIQEDPDVAQPDQQQLNQSQASLLAASSATGSCRSGSKTDTPTPATLRSFFRSTSSAAFNAFASSFQHQSSSSVSTPATVVPATQGIVSGHGSFFSASQSGCRLSTSNDVFEPPGSPSGESRLELGAAGSQQTESRSPVSPISITSTRFFSRIRHKFSLSPNMNLPTSRPASSISNSTSASTMTATTQVPVTQKPERTFVEHSSRPLNKSPQPAKVSLTESFDDYDRLVSTRRPSLQRQLDEQVNQVYKLAVERKLLSNPKTAPPETKTEQSVARDLIMRPLITSAVQQKQQPAGYVPETIYQQQAPSDFTSSQFRPLLSQWPDSSQQSIDSSSSARSLRSCWFSMPELYAMNCDSSSQSPSGALHPFNPPLADQLQRRLTEARPSPKQWPSEQLYKQVVAETNNEAQRGANWSLSDLNLTSDDIARGGYQAANPTKSEWPRVGDSPEPTPGCRPAISTAELAKGATLDDSVCVSIKSSSSAGQGVKGDAEPVADESRPTSQNSTISNTSCALSDLNSSSLHEPASAPAPAPPLPPSEQKTRPDKADWSDEKLLGVADSKQRAMSLATDSVSASTPGGLLSAVPGPNSRRRSALGELINYDVAPAAQTLDLRMSARKNRVKLTDLHPITFINDRKFLNQMNSLRNAGDTKLNAIFNGPVGRRLSVNAEMAQHSPFGQTGKSGIKIGLTGYLYLDPALHPGYQRQSGLLGLSDTGRRTSLAPNFWRQAEPGTNSGVAPELAPDSSSTRPRSASCVGQTPSMSSSPVPQQAIPTVSPEPHRSRTPSVGYAFERRPLSRLSESSIEEPTPPTLPADERRTLKRIGEEMTGVRPRGLVARSMGKPRDAKKSSVSSSSEAETSAESNEEPSDQLAAHLAPGTTDSSDSSSDDGDLDRLVAQYPDQYSGGESLPGRTTATSERVVRNDMILKQLLLASNAVAPATNLSTNKFQDPMTLKGQRQRNEMRRFSAINLYQRDTDVFVANSMKRPPSASQIQVLPLLTGTLPILPASETYKGARASTQSPKAVSAANERPAAGVRSIISGSSGRSATGESPQAVPLARSHSSVSSAMVAEVDVEEQINRLRQQEKRSLVLGKPYASQGNSSSVNKLDDWTYSSDKLLQQVSNKSSTTSSATDEFDLAQVTVPSKPTIPAILQQPDSKLLEPDDIVQSEPETQPEPKEGGSNSEKLARLATPAKSPPLSLNLTMGGSPTSTLLPSTTALASPPTCQLPVRPDPSAYSVSKSCEPFGKQLDTIIEGRGLLLGGEQQADPSYANRLRRLSGNHSRRSSLGNGARESSADDDSSPWCRCDFTSPGRRRSLHWQCTSSLTQQASGKTLPAKPSAAGSSQISASSRFVLDTVKCLARRTLNNLTAASSFATGERQKPVADPAESRARPNPMQRSRQQRSSSMVVSSCSATWQPTLPSTLLREKQRRERNESTLKQSANAGSDDEELMLSRSDSSSETGSPDDSSLMSLDDAEDYLAKNKENKMKEGRSLESSSSSDSSSICLPDALDTEHQTPADRTSRKLENDEDEEETLKVCYKCNKKIQIERSYYQARSVDRQLANGKLGGEGYYDEDIDDEVLEEEEEQLEAGTRTQGDAHSTGMSAVASPADPTVNRVQRTVSAVSHRGSMRNATRRSASMNSADHEQSGPVPHANRRKNKWHIQRNLAPKLKRQRSFSANYAPEVPNPVMPPPRRFSAAPTLICPHRNKSSSHSSSSLHHTYSIDSSESMITVIPAYRAGQDFKRASRGSLSCQSGQGLDPAMPRSPLSPRSPSRCSPGLLTPSEPPVGLGGQNSQDPPFSPATTNTTTCSSSALPTMIPIQLQHHSQSAQQQSSMWLNQLTGLDQTSASSFQHLASSTSCSLALPDPFSTNLPSLMSNENLSIAAENGTSYNSSRRDDFGSDDDAQSVCLEGEEEDKVDDHVQSTQINDSDNIRYTGDNDINEETTRSFVDHDKGSSNGDAIIQADPNKPFIRETINEFCVRHSREELECLIGQIKCLKISDCYFSERNSILCMIVEITGDDEGSSSGSQEFD